MSLHALMFVICSIIATVHISSSMSTDGIGQLEQALQQQLHTYASQLEHSAARIHERYQRSRVIPSEHHRSRRSGDTRHSYVAGTGVGNREVLHLETINATAGTALDFEVSAWEHITLSNGDEYLATIQLNKVEIFQLNLTLEAPLTSVFTHPVVATAIEFVHLTRPERAGLSSIEQSYIAIASDTEVVLFTVALNGTFQLSQTLDVEGVTDIKALYINSLSYLALGRAEDNISAAPIKSLLYKWSTMFTVFELSQELSTYEAMSVDSFTIGDNTYLAFAERNNNSLVFRYDRKLSVFKVYQRLEVVGASHVIYFTSAYTHFLLFNIPPRNISVFYKWQFRAFYEFQEVSTPNGNSWTELSPTNCQDDSLLLLSSGLPSPDSIKMYQFYLAEHGFYSALSNGASLQLLDDGSIVGASSAIMIGDGGDPLYIAVAFDSNDPANNNQASILQVTASIQPVKDPLQEEIEVLQEEIATLTNSMDVYEADVNSTQIRLADAVTLDGDQEIAGLKDFIGIVTINGSATVAEIAVEGDANVPIAPGEDGNLNILDERLSNQTGLLADITTLLNNAVTLDTNQSVTGHKNFTTVIIDGALFTGNLTAKEINEHDIHQLHMDAVRLDKAQTIYGQINFTHDVNITSDLNVTGEINGLDLEADVVLTNKEQTVTASKIFDNSVAVTGSINMTAGSNVNGLDVSQQVVTLIGDYTLAGNIVFQDTMNIDGGISTSGNIDGVDVAQLASDAMTLAGNQTIQGSVTIQSVATFNTDVQVTEFINDDDLSDIEQRALKLAENRQVTGKKTFNGPINIDGNLQVDGTVDGLDWPNDILTIRGNNTITGEKTFLGTVNVTSSISVTGTIDGLDLSEQVVTLSGNHSISGVKNFSSGIRVDGDVIVDGTVDGVDVANLNASVVTLTTDQTIQGAVTFGDSANFQDNLSVDGLVNDVNITFLYLDAVFNDKGAVQEITAQKTFANEVSVPSGFIDIVGLVNGNNMTQDFLDKVTDQVVTGQKTFSDGLSVNANLTISGLIHDINLTQLYQEAVLTWRDTEISGLKTFMSDVKIEGSLLMADSVTINGFDISEDFMMTNRQQTVTGLKYFDNMKVEEDLSVYNLTISDALNGRNFTDFVANRITLTTDEVIIGSWVISNNSYVNGNTTVTGTVNDLHLAELADNVVYKSEAQTITGIKTFTGTVSVLGNVICDALVDGMNISDINTRAMFIDENQDISGQKTFLENVIVTGDVDVQGLLNDVDIVPLLLDAVYDNKGLQYISAEKTFEAGFTALQDVSVSGYVDGIDLSLQMLTKTGDQEISGHYTFAEDVNITGNFEIDGCNINDVNIETLNDTLMRTNLPQTIVSTLTFIQDVYVEDDVPVTGFVDGVNLTDLKLNAVMLDETIDVSGDLYFTQPVTFLDDILATGLIHGLDFAAWAAEIVTIDSVQSIPNLRVFTDAITMLGGFTVTGNISAQDAFDRDLTEFIDDTVLLQGDQTITGRKTFNDDVNAQSNVNVTGTVNDVKVATEVVTLDGCVGVTGTVNGVKVATEVVTLDGCVGVTGTVNDVKVATEVVTLDGCVGVTGTVNGVKVATEVVTLDGNQDIDGNKTFTQNITVNGNITVAGIVNGVNIAFAAADTFMINNPQAIVAKKTFKQTVIVNGSISVGDLVDGIDLSQEAVTLDTDQTIAGEKTFEDGVTIRGYVDITGTTCDVNFDEVSNTRISLTANEIVNSTLTFTADVTFHEDVTITGVFNNYNLTALKQTQDDNTADTEAKTRELDWIADHQCNQLDELQNIYHDAFADLSHLSQVQSFMVHAESFESFTISDIRYLAMARTYDETQATCIDSIIYQWDSVQEQYVETERLPTRGGKKWHSFWIGDALYLAIANSMTVPCSGDSLVANTIYFYNGTAFEYFQDIAGAGTYDIKTVAIGDDVFLAVANGDNDVSGGNSTIFKYNNVTEQFDLAQTISIGDATGVEFVEVGDDVFMVFTATDESYASVFIYEPQNQTFVLNHTLASSMASAVESFGFNGQTGLIIANHGHDLAADADLVVHYWSEADGAFVESTKIPILSAASVKAFHVGGYLYVAAIRQYASVQLFQYLGSSGFVNKLTHELYGVTSVEVYDMETDFHLAVGVDPPDGSMPVYPVIINGNVISDSLSDPDVVAALCENDWSVPILHDPPEALDPEPEPEP
ncbi:uncharacterized protein [Amphiura filiformis]|uniref:uncharacterized protein n=1 Tax=Amphiura filiformis TaxID=82378 RepID=UPI003B21A1F5